MLMDRCSRRRRRRRRRCIIASSSSSNCDGFIIMTTTTTTGMMMIDQDYTTFDNYNNRAASSNSCSSCISSNSNSNTSKRQQQQQQQQTISMRRRVPIISSSIVVLLLLLLLLHVFGSTRSSPMMVSSFYLRPPVSSSSSRFLFSKDGTTGPFQNHEYQGNNNNNKRYNCYHHSKRTQHQQQQQQNVLLFLWNRQQQQQQQQQQPKQQKVHQQKLTRSTIIGDLGGIRAASITTMTSINTTSSSNNNSESTYRNSSSNNTNNSSSNNNTTTSIALDGNDTTTTTTTIPTTSSDTDDDNNNDTEMTTTTNNTLKVTKIRPNDFLNEINSNVRIVREKSDMEKTIIDTIEQSSSSLLSSTTNDTDNYNNNNNNNNDTTTTPKVTKIRPKDDWNDNSDVRIVRDKKSDIEETIIDTINDTTASTNNTLRVTKIRPNDWNDNSDVRIVRGSDIEETFIDTINDTTTTTNNTLRVTKIRPNDWNDNSDVRIVRDKSDIEESIIDTIEQSSLLLASTIGTTPKVTKIRPKDWNENSDVRIVQGSNMGPIIDTIEQSSTVGTGTNYDEMKDNNEEEIFVWSKQWYPVRPISYLEDIGNTIQPFTLLGRKYVIWKSTNASVVSQLAFTVMDDECPHRLAPLSTGKVVNDSNGNCTVMCRFHGWQFNSIGACTGIPMFPLSNDNDVENGGSTKAAVDAQQQQQQQRRRYDQLRATVKVRTYPTQLAGGLVWVYLGDDINEDGSAPIDIAQGMLLPDLVAANTEFLLNIVPVGYTSMVENSFDPSHAPFIHEGITDFGGGVFSPADALAMQSYKLQHNTSLTKNGFILEHTPYQKSVKDRGNSIVTRQFLPPVTQRTKFPFFDVVLYFLPVNVRETAVIGTFPFQLPKYIIQLLQLVTTTPKSSRYYEQYIMDWFHTYYIISAGARRFYLQDMITMRGQDTTKLLKNNYNTTKVIMDLAPTPADRGINLFQRWLRTIGKGGPFADKTAIISSDHLIERHGGSMYEYHGKYCPRCQRSLKRAKIIQHRASRISTIFATISTIGALILSRIGSSSATTTTATTVSKSFTGPLFGYCIALLAYLVQKHMRNIQERMHKSFDTDDVTDVYAY